MHSVLSVHVHTYFESDINVHITYRNQDYSYWTRTKPMKHLIVSGLLCTQSKIDLC